MTTWYVGYVQDKHSSGHGHVAIEASYSTTSKDEADGYRKDWREDYGRTKAEQSENGYKVVHVTCACLEDAIEFCAKHGVVI